MYVCICKNVTEKDIKQAIGDGACSFDCLQERLEVSTCCGQCEPIVADCLEKSLDSAFPAEFALTA